jgi:hypothetical protein
MADSYLLSTDYRKTYSLNFSSICNNHKLFEISLLNINIYDIEGRLVNSIEQNSFKDYGSIKEFRFYDSKVINKLELGKILNAKPLADDYIIENWNKIIGFNTKLYSFYFLNCNEPYDSHVPLHRIHDLFTSDGHINDIFIDKVLGDAKIIGLNGWFPYIKVSWDYKWVMRIDRYGHYYVDLFLLVNNEYQFIKKLLNKLIYIYTYISDYLKENNITLKDIFEDIDLYVAGAAVAATAPATAT